MVCRKSDDGSAARCAECLASGDVVIIPTDTVYGFSGIAGRGTAPDTADRIRRIKGRGEEKPFIQLIAQPDDIFAYTRDVIPPKLLARWPGALTIVVRELGTGGTTAFRCPGDEWLRTIIAQCGSPIYSTSVNRSGLPAIGDIAQIRAEFERDVALIVCDGDRKNALPSTVVSVRDGGIAVLRQGSVIV